MSRTEVLVVAPTGPDENENFFTVDTTGPVDVPVLSRGGTLIEQTLVDGNLKHLFIPVDNIEVLSWGVFIPHMFVLSQQFQFVISATAIDTGGSVTAGVTELGGANGGNFMVLPNVGEEISQFIQTRQFHALREPTVEHLDTVSYQMVINSGRISMLNVPAVMNGIDVDLRPYLKIKHNFDLTDVETPA